MLKKIKAIYYPYKLAKDLFYNAKDRIHVRNTASFVRNNIKRVSEKIKEGKALKVVFLIQYIPAWNKLEPIYLRMKEDDRYEPVIVCVPLNIQNNTYLGKGENDTYEYFKEHGFDAVNALQEDGRWLDLKSLEPDYLFHSRPYNNYMPLEYTSTEIKKYALLCNVLYGQSMILDIMGVAINTDYFRDVYMYFASDKSEVSYYQERFAYCFKKGLQRCFPYGAMGMTQMLESLREKNPSEFRKTILWTPRWSTDPEIGGSNFFRYKDVLLDFASKHKDIKLILRPHPLMFDNFINTGEMSREEADAFKKLCETEANL